jgi:hypothetical protein
MKFEKRNTPNMKTSLFYNVGYLSSGFCPSRGHYKQTEIYLAYKQTKIIAYKNSYKNQQIDKVYRYCGTISTTDLKNIFRYVFSKRNFSFFIVYRKSF